MSVIVKNMKMPRHCLECRMYVECASYCKGWRHYEAGMESKRPDWCPLVESSLQDWQLIVLEKILSSSPTVIEAEGSEE